MRRLPSESKSWNAESLTRAPRSITRRSSSSGVSTGRYPCAEKHSLTTPVMRSRASASLGRMSLNPRGVAAVTSYPFGREGRRSPGAGPGNADRLRGECRTGAARGGRLRASRYSLLSKALGHAGRRGRRRGERDAPIGDAANSTPPPGRLPTPRRPRREACRPPRGAARRRPARRLRAAASAGWQEPGRHGRPPACYARPTHRNEEGSTRWGCTGEGRAWA